VIAAADAADDARRIAARAVEHAMLIVIWHILTAGVAYADLGGDFYTRHNPDKISTGRSGRAAG